MEVVTRIQNLFSGDESFDPPLDVFDLSQPGSWRTMLDILPIPIFLLDFQCHPTTGKPVVTNTLWGNRASLSFWQVTLSVFQSTQLWKDVGPEHLERLYKHLNVCSSSPTSSSPPREVFQLYPLGKEVTVESICSPLWIRTNSYEPQRLSSLVIYLVDDPRRPSVSEEERLMLEALRYTDLHMSVYAADGLKTITRNSLARARIQDAPFYLSPAGRRRRLIQLEAEISARESRSRSPGSGSSSQEPSPTHAGSLSITLPIPASPSNSSHQHSRSASISASVSSGGDSPSSRYTSKEMSEEKKRESPDLESSTLQLPKSSSTTSLPELRPSASDDPLERSETSRSESSLRRSSLSISSIISEKEESKSEEAKKRYLINRDIRLHFRDITESDKTKPKDWTPLPCPTIEEITELASKAEYGEKLISRVVQPVTGVWLAVNMFVIRDPGTNKKALLVLEHDVTERQQLLFKAKAAERAKSDFLSQMSHEIRSPMNVVLGNVELLQELPLTAQQKELVNSIEVSGQHLLTVINDILDVAKIEAGHLQLEQHPFRLALCIEQAIELSYQPKTHHRLEVVFLIGDDVPPAIMGDITRLRQILANLIGNSLKFTAQGEVVVSVQIGQPSIHQATYSPPMGSGRPTQPSGLASSSSCSSVFTFPSPQPTTPSPSASPPLLPGSAPTTLAQKLRRLPPLPENGVTLQFSVTDTGIGIPLHRQKKLFRAFSQADTSTARVYGGTGLGLLICRKLVRLMGGRIWVESQEGHGSTFSFTIQTQPAIGSTKLQSRWLDPEIQVGPSSKFPFSQQGGGGLGVFGHGSIGDSDESGYFSKTLPLVSEDTPMRKEDTLMKKEDTLMPVAAASPRMRRILTFPIRYRTLGIMSSRAGLVPQPGFVILDDNESSLKMLTGCARKFGSIVHSSFTTIEHALALFNKHRKSGSKDLSGKKQQPAGTSVSSGSTTPLPADICIVDLVMSPRSGADFLLELGKLLDSEQKSRIGIIVLIPPRSQLRSSREQLPRGGVFLRPPNLGGSTSSIQIPIPPQGSSEESFDFSAFQSTLPSVLERSSGGGGPSHDVNATPWIPLYRRLQDILTVFPRNIQIHKPIKLSILEKNIQILVKGKPIPEDETKMENEVVLNPSVLTDLSTNDADLGRSTDIEWIDRSPRAVGAGASTSSGAAILGRSSSGDTQMKPAGGKKKKKRRIDRRKSKTEPLEQSELQSSLQPRRSKTREEEENPHTRSFSYSPSYNISGPKGFFATESESSSEMSTETGTETSLPPKTAKSIPVRKRKLGIDKSSRGKKKSELTALKLKILLAEDVAVNAQLALNMLKSGGYTADHAIDGLDALVKVSKGYEQGDPYDLIFMDCQMPGMDGPAATREIRRRFGGPALKPSSGSSASALPIIIALTADVMEKNVEECKAAGMNDFLCKPYKKHQILSMLYKWGLLIHQIREGESDIGGRQEGRRRSSSEHFLESASSSTSGFQSSIASHPS